MSLKTKIGIILLSVFVLYGVVDYGIQRFVIFPSFLELEREKAITDVKRSVEALQREIYYNDYIAWDWAAWDDTYDFIQTRSEAYIDTNLVIETFTDDDLNVLFFVDTGGKVIWGETRDREAELVDLPELPTDALAANHPLIVYETEEVPLEEVTVAGVYQTGKGPMLISSRPILTSQSEGPIRGSVIRGLYLSDEIVEKLVEQTQVDFQVFPIMEDTLPEQHKGIPGRITDDAPYLVEVAGSDYLNVYTTMPDIEGNAALLITTKIPRDISAQGSATMRYALYSIMAAGVGVLLIMLLLLQWTILKPVTKLTRHALAVGKSADLGVRLSFQRKDEIGTLANEFDSMMDQLYQARSKLLEQSYYSGLAEMASGLLHNARNILTPMVGQISAASEQIKKAPIGNLNKAVAELEGEGLDPEREQSLNRYLLLGSRELLALIQKTDNQLDNISQHVVQIEEILGEQDKFSHLKKALAPLHIKNIAQKASTLIPNEFLDTVSIEIDPGISELPAVLAEEVVLTQVFTNLLNNAAESIVSAGKHTGNIMIKGSVEKNEDEELVHVEFHDNGAGIDADALKRIFDRDFSSKKSNVAGMGLHWSGNVLSAMNGTLMLKVMESGKVLVFISKSLYIKNNGELS